MTKRYELMPDDCHKSFYGKAYVELYDDGTETLFSYGTPIITLGSDGVLRRVWHGWSATTGRHVKAYCGLNKSGYDKLPFID